MNIAVLANRPVSGEVGGAERFYEGLADSLRQHGQTVSIIDIPVDESTFEGILQGYLQCYDLDLSQYDGVISTKAPTYLIRHHNHMCYLMHTTRVFYDMFSSLESNQENNFRRELIHRLDTLALQPPRTKKVFSIGHEVSNRLLKWNGITSKVLYPGISMTGFYNRAYEYVFVPGRLHSWKRVDLMIRSMQYVTAPVKMIIAGTGEESKSLQTMAAEDPRIEFRGYVDDNSLRELYSNALVVPFVPIREDYGYIVHEAFQSKKPVITCTDSGEPAHFVRNGENGFVVKPEAKEIAAYIDRLYIEKDMACKMGESGYIMTNKISWDVVADTLIKAFGG